MRAAASTFAAPHRTNTHTATLWLLGAACLVGAARAETPEPLALPTVEVVSTALLPGLGTPLQDVPANVQVLDGQRLRQQGADSLADFLDQQGGSIHVNSAQGNPFQTDVNFRGFTASPLLGLPQGLSVFVDGVRANEPFGDVVNWDLIPTSAIANIQLIPGSNPVFGLNTLGGALSIRTRSGLDSSGGSIEFTTGAFGRRALAIEQGGRKDNWNYFVSAQSFDETGWGEHNPSQVRQVFGRLGHVSGQDSTDLIMTLTDNTLEGSQTLPLSYAENIRQAYTHPDINRNRLGFLNLKISRVIGESAVLDANIYYRRYHNRNFSSNVNDTYDGITVLNPATNDRSTILQDGYGLGLQLTQLGTVAGKSHQLVTGLSTDLGQADFTQEIQPADFTADRGTVATGGFTVDTQARTHNGYYGIYAADTLALDERWSVTLSGRHNLATVRIADRSGIAPELNGDHSFVRFNPAVGINYNPTARLTGYASYNEGMRTPTPVELTCADPAAPCKLPNNFLADPPLQMVVARTLEIGARGRAAERLDWNAAAYRTELQDDIQFISSGGAVNAGYFQNTGNTLRQGLELGASRQSGNLLLSARYGYQHATYLTGFTLQSPANSSADAGGDIQVRPGDRIPGIPLHTLKLRAEYRSGERWTIGSTAQLASAIYARGDENNQDANGPVPGYAVFHLDARYQPSRSLELFARINNVFDQRYATFATLGENFFPNYNFAPANPASEQFRGFAAPRAAWAGLRYRWN